ncbi:NUDIX domain-containing protein [uncultured Gemella sp.]|uniref:NUDIX domain-containing protein n=1 Tax=uncultured Gemella sp. TaxID=254352 RepID=UPI0028D2DAD7|nr:NUDIX domain-containing protein [uncultured Gemella sp.]
MKKVRVSYKNRYDLPGSSQKEYENLVETLVREFQEETGYSIENYGQSRVHDLFVEEINRMVHYITAFYDVEIDRQYQEIVPRFIDFEQNDSNGACWILISELNINNASPLLMKLKQEIMNDSSLLEKTEYKFWEIL